MWGTRMRAVHVCVLGLLATVYGCLPIFQCDDERTSQHLGDFSGFGLSASSTLTDGAGSFVLELERAQDDHCASLVDTATADVNGMPMERQLDGRNVEDWCGCPRRIAFSLDAAAPPASADAIFEIVDGDSVARMWAPGLLLVGLALRYPDQPLVAGQPVELLLEAPADTVVDMEVAVTAGDPAYATFDPATFQDPAWLFTVPAGLAPGAYKLVGSWGQAPAVTCDGWIPCHLQATAEASLDVTVVQ